jgi:hypothetical protein
MAEAGAPSVLNDLRWKAFNAKGFACSCGERHVGLFPIHMHQPAGWPGSKEYANDDDVRLDGDFFSHNLCVWEGKYFAVRMRLPIQMQGADRSSFLYTVWASLNRPDFEGYLNARRNGRLNNQAKAPARLVNRISGYPDTANLMGVAFQQEDGGQPLLLVLGQKEDNSANHRLVQEQRNGIGIDRMLELFAEYHHDMRPAAQAVRA